MNENQLREYIELQRQLIVLLSSRRNGWTMAELDMMRRIQEFEDNLPCNQDQGQ